MRHLIAQFAQDDAGFLVSAELILVSTIAVLSLIVGLKEVSTAINYELEDVACAFGSINQSFGYHGLSGCKGKVVGSKYGDMIDECDCASITCANSGAEPEARHHNRHGGWDY